MGKEQMPSPESQESVGKRFSDAEKNVLNEAAGDSPKKKGLKKALVGLTAGVVALTVSYMPGLVEKAQAKVKPSQEVSQVVQEMGYSALNQWVEDSQKREVASQEIRGDLVKVFETYKSNPTFSMEVLSLDIQDFFDKYLKISDQKKDKSSFKNFQDILIEVLDQVKIDYSSELAKNIGSIVGEMKLNSVARGKVENYLNPKYNRNATQATVKSAFSSFLKSINQEDSLENFQIFEKHVKDMESDDNGENINYFSDLNKILDDMKLIYK